ncbi:hypothetical protein LCGC14_1032880 [marine sediment metagenome]|uniref:Uncharacterized protein n=1 Tax=marine sediment metagenome TaxID=412755 RepID=A0A0F9MYQ6_9ZZZZ
MIWNDAQRFVKIGDMVCANLSADDARAEVERSREEEENPFWQALLAGGAIHTVFADKVAARRAYVVTETQPVCVMACILLVAYCHSWVVVVPGIEPTSMLQLSSYGLERGDG